MSIDTFNLFLGVMSLIALFVFIALYFVKAGYGIFRTASWGVAISNKLAWILMEAPVFVVMCVMWIYSERRFEPVIFTFFLFFQIHYFQRAFIFPLLLKGKSKMPLAIMSMGVLFNLLNGYMQGKWIFYLARIYMPKLPEKALKNWQKLPERTGTMNSTILRRKEQQIRK